MPSISVRTRFRVSVVALTSSPSKVYAGSTIRFTYEPKAPFAKTV